MADLVELARRFRALSESQLPRAPFSSQLSAAIAEHPQAIDLLRAAPEQHQQPVLLLAALHADVLLDPHCELAAWYPTVAEVPRTDDATAALVRHCSRRSTVIRETVGRRSTQTNEVGRCGLLVPALGLVGAEMGGLALVDVGASAGLNLLLDHYSYDYRPGGRVGGSSEVHLEVGTRGHVPVPAEIPQIVGRIGIDRDPVDVTDADATRWLRACVWPDQADRFRRLEAALRIARREPVDVRRGDAVDDLATGVAVANAVGHPVVLNSWVLNYLSEAGRRAYVREIDRLGHELDLSWVFAESPAQAPELPTPPHLAGRHLTALQLVRWRNGRQTVEHLALAHPHGYWLHWAV